MNQIKSSHIALLKEYVPSKYNGALFTDPIDFLKNMEAALSALGFMEYNHGKFHFMKDQGIICISLTFLRLDGKAADWFKTIQSKITDYQHMERKIFG